MEGLKKLEQLHMIMTIMESEDATEIPKSHHDSNDSRRFLSSFALLLAEPCGDLSLNDKCRLISDHLPKISAVSVDAELKLAPGRTDFHMNNLLLDDHTGRKTDYSLFHPSTSGEMCFIGMDAMQRANSTIEDFCRSYFMFHGMDPNTAKAIFRYLPVLSFTESYIYQLDTLNERMLHTVIDRGVEHFASSHMEVNGRWEAKYVKAFESGPLRPLLHLLEQNGLLTERIREELRCGEEYWALERKLCGRPENKLREISFDTRRTAVTCEEYLLSAISFYASHRKYSVQMSVLAEDVMRAIHLKSFDYRVLNLLLYELRREEVNELYMDFLSVSELLVEIADDLFDYEEDVLENNFNILRMFVRLYGTSKASTVLAKYIAEAEDRYDSLLKALDPRLSQRYRRRCEEATEEGGSISVHPLGSWTIPLLIADEELYKASYGHQVTTK